MEFRNDINGLRAVSIIAVVLFHFGVPGFSGGFVGVDVFFVISGYLMTAIILKTYSNGNFSLLNFYLSRARRIIPAIFILCVTLLILSWYYILPVDYVIIAKGALASMAFVSNVVYWRESGYFDTAAQNNWFLHTWSLSVEWQFYVLYPIMLSVLLRFSRNILAVRLLLAIMCAASFVVSIVGARWPTASFYLLPTRAWELMAGGAVCTGNFNLPRSGMWRSSLEILGLLALALSVYLFHPGMLWPGYMAIVPVAGCALIIVAERKESIWSKCKSYPIWRDRLRGFRRNFLLGC
jgi:peptidoglycan/LPS O-acetylase OafA/YrhL